MSAIVSRTATPIKHEGLVKIRRTILATQISRLMNELDLQRGEVQKISRLSPDNISNLLKARKTGKTMTIEKLEQLAAALDCVVEIESSTVPVGEWNKETTTLEELLNVGARINFVEKMLEA